MILDQANTFLFLNADSWTAIFTAVIAGATIWYVCLTRNLWAVALKTLDQKMPFLIVEDIPFGNLTNDRHIINHEKGILGIKIKNYGDSPALRLKINAGYYYDKDLQKRIGYVEEDGQEIAPNAIFFLNGILQRSK